MALSANSPWRRSLLALVMLAILLAAAGAAWVLVLGGQRRQAVGEQIVATIHAQKLSHWYAEKAQVQWYLGSKNNRLVGFQAVIRSSKDGQHQGLRVIALGPTPPRTERRVIEKWNIDDTAATGQYESILQEPGASNPVATIKLENGKVSMTQLLQQLLGQASGPAPANFLAEGTFPLAMRLVVEQKADAIFSVIFDDHPNFGKVIDFVGVRIRYAGTVSQDSTPQNKVMVSAAGSQVTYWLNADGDVVRIGDEAGGITWSAATEKQVGEHYPAAPLQVWQYSENILPQGPGFWKRLFGVSL